MGVPDIRKRPGMYVGDTSDGTGLHNMVYELATNAIKEAMAGFADRIDVILNADTSCTVRDNGRGIPVDLHPAFGVSAAEVVMTYLHARGVLRHAGGNFAWHDLDVPDDLLGAGAAVVNALSETLVLRIWRDGAEHTMRFREGVPETRLETNTMASSRKDRHGTEITFTPSKTIFADTDFDFARIEQRLRELAVHAKDTVITLKDERSSQDREQPLSA